MAHSQILQRAFAAFIANRAIQRVAAQEKFQHIVARRDDLRRICLDVHASADSSSAGGLQLGKIANLGAAVIIAQQIAGGAVAGWRAKLHQAHTAHADWLHLGMIAEDGDVVIGVPFGGID